MKKSELIKQIAEQSGTTAATAEKVLVSLINAIQDELKADRPLSVSGLGTFRITERKARKGRNPITGEEIMIKKKKVPTFRAAKSLKETFS